MQSLFHVRRQLDEDEVFIGKEVILTRLIDDPEAMVRSRGLIRYYLVELPQLQRRWVAVVPHADRPPSLSNGFHFGNLTNDVNRHGGCDSTFAPGLSITCRADRT